MKYLHELVLVIWLGIDVDVLWEIGLTSSGNHLV